MADYYTNFSFILPLTDVAQKKYALQLAQTACKCRFEESALPASFPAPLKEQLENWLFEVADHKEGLWVHSDSGGMDAVCSYVQHLLQQFKLTYRIGFEWSFDCNKPRTDAFGGGAAVVSAQAIKSMTTNEWLGQQMEEPYGCGCHIGPTSNHQPCAQYNKRHIFTLIIQMKHIFVVLTLGYWGRGTTLNEAALNCFKYGSRKTEPALARIIISPTDLPDLEKQVTVNDAGDILYPQTCEIIPLFSPKNSRVKLGCLISKPTKTKQ